MCKHNPETLVKIGNIGINGFGRIGRLFLRQCLMQKLPVVALNDPNVSPQYVAYMLKYDSSSQGPFKKQIALDGNNLILGPQSIALSFEKDPKAVNWGKKGVNCVVECSGQFTTIEKATQHLQDKVSKVFISTPSPDAPMFVPGVNLDQYKVGTKILSSASCTTNCLAVLAKIVHEKFKILEGVVTTVHASPPTPSDGPDAKAWRSKRKAIANIIPTTNDAAKVVGQLIPDLKDKLTSMALCVPLPAVSVIDLTCRLGNPTKLDDIKAAMKEASQCDMKDILAFVDDEVVSSDFLGSKYSAAFDARACVQLSDTFIKLIAWFDNESGCASQLTRLVKHVQTMDKAAEPKTKDDEKESEFKQAEKKLAKKCGELALQIKSVQKRLKKQCTELEEKCTEKEEAQKCAEKEEAKKCAEKEEAKKCAEMEEAKKCAEKEEEIKCAEKEEQKKCAEIEAAKKCEESAKAKKSVKDEGAKKCAEKGEAK